MVGGREGERGRGTQGRPSAAPDECRRQDADLVLGDVLGVSGLLSRYDQSFLSMHGTVISFLQDYKHQTGKGLVAMSSLWFRIQSMYGVLGSRPTVMPAQYQTPSAWASIGELVNRINNVHLHTVSLLELEGLLTSLKTELKSHVVDKVSLVQSTMSSKSRGLQTFVIDVACSLGKIIASLEVKGPIVPQSPDLWGQALAGLNQDAEVGTRLLKLESQMNGSAANTFGEDLMNTAENPSLITSRIEARIDSMEVKIGKLFAKGDDLSIKFSGLGFTKPPDANSWLEKELPHHPSGLIVDAHMVFERVFYNMDNTDTLARLQQCYKIKVTTIADGVAITSLDSKIPKFFSRSHGHKVVKADGSFLDSIASYQE